MSEPRQKKILELRCIVSTRGVVTREEYTLSSLAIKCRECAHASRCEWIDK